MAYEAKSHLRPEGLSGLSENQITQHWKLYEGYVANTNALLAELQTLRAEGKGGAPIFADRRRRLGFEFNGMVLHEHYFGNLRAGVPALPERSALRAALAGQYGSFEAWQEDFARTGASRSIGWAICYLDPAEGGLTNHFVQLHEEGNVAGFIPVVVMDVWEHAYMLDYGAGGRPDYIKAFFANLDWRVAQERFAKGKEGKIPARF